MNENNEIIEELIIIRKELQNIRVILQSQFVPDFKIERTRNENGKTIRKRIPIKDPLGDLRKRHNIDRQSLKC